MSDNTEQLLKDLIRELKNFTKNSGTSNGRNNTTSRSSNDTATVQADVKSAIKKIVKELNDYVDVQQKHNKYVSDVISAHEKINKKILEAENDALKIQRLQEKKFESVVRLADSFDGTVETMDKKAKQMAEMIASSSKTFGGSFKNFAGGLNDFQNIMNEFIRSRSEIVRLTDSEIDAVKKSKEASKEIAQALKKAAEELKAEKERLQDYTDGKLSLKGGKKANIDKFDKSIADLQKNIDDLTKQKKDQEKLRKEYNKNIKANNELVKEIDETVDAVSEFGTKLFDASKSVNIFGKELDKAKSKARDWVITTATLVGAFKLVAEGAMEIADKYRLIADVGMAGDMSSFAKTALHLNLTVSQLAKIVGENRAAFARSTVSIAEFGEIAKSNYDSLQDIGMSYEQAASAQAKMMNATMAALGSDQKTNNGLIRKSITDQVTAFRMLSVATGETTDALAAEYESLLTDVEISKKLQSLDNKERNQKSQEMLAMYQHYKLLGLNNEQIKNAINLQNASKYRLGDRLSGAAMLSSRARTLGMSQEDANTIMKLAAKRNKSATETSTFTALMKELNQRSTSQIQQGTDPQSEVGSSMEATFGQNQVYRDAMALGSDINAAKSEGRAQVDFAKSTEQLIAASSGDTDKMIAAYTNGITGQSEVITKLMTQANPSNDMMASVGRVAENAKAIVDSIKDTPIIGASKILLGAAIAFGIAVYRFSKAVGKSDWFKSGVEKAKDWGSRAKAGAKNYGGKAKNWLSRTGSKIGAGSKSLSEKLIQMAGSKGGSIGKLGAGFLRKLPVIGALASLSFSAKDVYDAATSEAKPEEKRASMVKSISSAIGGVLGGIAGTVFGGPIGGFIGALIGDFLGSAVGDGINWVIDNSGKMIDWVKDKALKAKNAIVNFNPFALVSELFDGVLGKILSSVAWMLEKASSIPGVGNSAKQQAQSIRSFLSQQESAKAVLAAPTSATIPMQNTGAPKNVNDVLAFGGNTGSYEHFKKIDPALQQKVIAYATAYNKATGKKLKITSGFRTTDEQRQIAASVPNGVAATPGTSPHEKGIAVDISPSDIQAANTAGVKLENFGLWQPMKTGSEFQHVQQAGVAASNRQAAELGILSPSQAASRVAPAPLQSPSINTASVAAKNVTSTAPVVPVTTNSAPTSQTPAASSNTDIVSLLNRIASLNAQQLNELKNIVNAARTTKLVSPKDQMKAG
jgi:hypothetical protein